jgi:hypothetical protein
LIRKRKSIRVRDRLDVCHARVEGKAHTDLKCRNLGLGLWDYAETAASRCAEHCRNFHLKRDRPHPQFANPNPKL